ncbi:MAG: ADP-ribosylglycohydrolase family protein [Archangium sp.]|nr:ADP-ribosylglycohydrolase family protein [Archangium sp.]MDP3570848.1 ADP-ribosylglycohydrolase family protein [Archangium sp.]
MSTLDERAAGCLWGLAWGDALGAPIEGWTEAEIAATFGAYSELPRTLDAVPSSKRRQKRRLGLHTDDTQQALALLAVVLSPGGWSPTAWAQCLVRGEQLGAWRGTGRHFDGAVQKLAAGASPEQAGSPSAGIGAAMRTAPLGALLHAQPARLRQIAIEASAVTHADLLACSLGYAVAFASARLVSGAPAGEVRAELPHAVADAEAEWLGAGRARWTLDRSASFRLSQALSALFALPQRGLRVLASRVLELGSPTLGAGAPPAHPNHGYSLLGGLFALGVGLEEQLEPRGALLEVVRLGEDTDTVGAMVGGLLGARFGADWIPRERLVDRLHLSGYATAVCSGAAPEPLEALLTREAAHSLRERESQR